MRSEWWVRSGAGGRTQDAVAVGVRFAGLGRCGVVAPLSDVVVQISARTRASSVASPGREGIVERPWWVGVTPLLESGGVRADLRAEEVGRGRGHEDGIVWSQLLAPAGYLRT